MEQSPSWEASLFSPSEAIPHISWKPKVHYRLYKCPPTLPLLSQINAVHDPTSCLLRIHLNIILPSTSAFPKWSLSLTIPHQSPDAPLLSPIRATCPAQLILYDLITRTIFSEEYRSLSSSLYSFLHSPVISALVGPNILLSTLFSNTLSLHLFHTHSKQQAKL